MMCAWKELISLLPSQLRNAINSFREEKLQEVRLRIHAPPELVLKNEVRYLQGQVTKEMLEHVINAASQYSPWSASTMAHGYLTAAGGHRIGVCGDLIIKNGRVEGIREISSLCIRVSRDFPGISQGLRDIEGSILILGAPGWGKTTLLRDWVREKAEKQTVCVIDERREIFPDGFRRGRRMDVLSGCSKKIGIEMAVRTMSPAYVAADEITAEEDCRALLDAAHCGVHFAATAHALSVQDFYSRGLYNALIQNNVFDTLVILHKDKSYRVEEVKKCRRNGLVQY